MFIIFLIVDILDVCRPYGAKEFFYKHAAPTGLTNGKRNACKNALIAGWFYAIIKR